MPPALIVDLNGYFVMTENMLKPLMYNSGLKIFSAETIDGEVERLQRRAG